MSEKLRADRSYGPPSGQNFLGTTRFESFRTAWGCPRRRGRPRLKARPQGKVARSLARQVAEALILATQAGPIASREDFLDGLLDRGAPMI